MFVDLFKKYRSIIIPVVIGGVLLLVGWIVYYNVFTFHIQSVRPGTNSIQLRTPQIDVYFNREINTDTPPKVFLGDIPLELFDAPNNHSISINTWGLFAPGAKYTLFIRDVISTDGYTIKEESITVSISDDVEQLTHEQEDKILELQQEHKSSAIKDPILVYIPYEKNNYYISTGLPTENNKPEVKVTVFLSREDSESNQREAIITEAKESANGYLRSLDGIDISQYTVTYIIQEP